MRIGKSFFAAAVWATCAALAILAGCGGGGGGGGGAPKPETPATGSQTISLTLTAKSTGYAYPIQIYLPASYRTGNTAYPTIYANDADDAFSTPGSTRFDRFKNVLERRGTQAIMVGIGNSANRQVDYNFPGATGYHEFVTRELIPLVESRYRADGKMRVLSGLSTGGSFVLTSFLKEAPDNLVFSHFLSSEAAIWQQAGLVATMEKELFDRSAGKQIPVTLILAHCTVGGNSADVVAMYQQLASRNYRGLKLSETSFANSHAAMDLPAFEDAIAKLFP